MNTLYVLAFFVAAAFVPVFSNPCQGKPDNPNGYNTISCYSKTYCLNQTLETETCTNGQVMERDSASCQDQATANTACGSAQPCSGTSGYVGDTNPCQTFYYCLGFTPFARQYCGAGTIFNQATEGCDFPWNVAAPCGTA